jgi:hypothetical protein
MVAVTELSQHLISHAELADDKTADSTLSETARAADSKLSAEKSAEPKLTDSNDPLRTIAKNSSGVMSTHHEELSHR